MKSESARLEREIALEKIALVENLAALEVKTREITDWRWQVRQRPLASVGVALAGGAVLAMLTGRRGPRAGHARDDGARGAPAASLMSHPLVERLLTALVIVAAEKAAETLGEMLPGLTQAMDDAPPGSQREA